MTSFRERANAYRDELSQKIVPFWLTHSPDEEEGGHFSCLTSNGEVYDSDKFLWMQGRFLWMCSSLGRSESLSSELRAQCVKEAERAAEFLLKNGRDGAGDWYFALNQRGYPIKAPYNIFTDVFVLMGLAEYISLYSSGLSITYRKEAGDAALDTWENIRNRKANPKGQYSKAGIYNPKYRPLNWPMIMMNLTQVLEDSPLSEKIGKDVLRSLRAEAAGDVLEYHLDVKEKLLRERVGPQGEVLLENMEGRLLNPGHGCETLSFLLETMDRDGTALDGILLSRGSIQRKLAEADAATPRDFVIQGLNWVLERGWDKEFGGLYYYQDVLSLPPEKLEWDMKLWWVHVESALAALRGYQLSGDKRLLDWYSTIDGYMWDKFRRDENNEWFAYLSRRGDVTHELAGGKWKGFFHLPRALDKMIPILESLEMKNKKRSL